MDKELENLINREKRRQELTLNLIPSENIAPPELLEIIGSPLTNKYSEGYIGKRYYPGTAIYDEIEHLAQSRALNAFGLKPSEWAVNVQPYSGSPAMHAIYFALLTRNNADEYAEKRGIDILGLSLSHGGHLTHGHLVNFSGILYQSVSYELNLKTGYIDYQKLEKLAHEYNPRIIVSGATAYPRKIDFKRIGAIAKKAGAYHVADISHIAGLIVAGVHPNPFSHADVVMTTTHKTLRGPRGAVIFARKKKIQDSILGHRMSQRTSDVQKLTIAEAIDKAVFPGLQGGPHNNVTAGIAWAFGEALTPKFKAYQKQVVKNAFVLASVLKKLGFTLVSGGTDNHLMLVDLRNKRIDGATAQDRLEESGITANRNSIPGDEKPFKPSGIRLGTPAVTSRGMKEKEMKQIARLIYQCLIQKKNVRREVEKICMMFPLPYSH